MLDELKKVIDAISSASFQLRSIITKTDATKVEYENKTKKIDAQQVEIDKKSSDLNTREGNVKHIESIVQATKDAKDLMEKARTSMETINDRQAKLDSDIKEFKANKTKADKDLADRELLHKKEIEAVIKERKGLEANKHKFAVEQKVANEMAK